MRWLPLVCLMLFVPQAGAMYKDQAGLVDWYRANIGRVQAAGFPRARGNKFGYVVTAQNIVAALNLRTGQTVWRQVLPAGEVVDQILVVPTSILTVSSALHQLRMWNSADGSLLWDEPLTVSTDTKPSIEAALLPGGEVVALVDSGRVEMRSVQSGRLGWSWSAPNHTRLVQLSISKQGDTVHLVGRQESKLVAISIDSRTGKLNADPIPMEGSKPSDQVHLSGDMAAQIDRSSCTLVVHDLPTAALQATHKLADDCAAVSILPLQMPSKLLVQSSATSTLLLELNAGSLTTVHTFAGMLSFASSHTSDGQALLSASSIHKSEATVAIYTLSPFESLSSSSSDKLSLSQNGAVRNSFLSSYTKSSGNIGARVMLVTADDSLSMIQNGELSWHREEALASIRQVEFAVPPSADSSTANEPAPVFADRFGFRRLAVMMTEAGKVLALNTETAEVVWSRFYASQGESHDAVSSLQQMVMLRNSREHPPECIVIGHDPMASSHFPTFLSSFNPITGSEAHFEALRYVVKHAILLPDKDAEQRRLLLIIDADYKAHVYPDTEEAQALVAQRLPQLFFHEVDKVAGVVTGFRIKKQADAYQAEQTWQIVLPETEKIDQISQRSTEENVFSPFHVTGSHNVLFKYLNPNLLVVSTVSEATPFFKSRVSQSDAGGSVHLYAIDAVSGHIVYHVAHANAAGPTNLVLSENWVVHSYWNQRQLRTELSVLELWEDHGVDESTAQLLTKNIKNKLFGTAKVSTRTGSHFVTGSNIPKHDSFSSLSKHAPPQKEEQSFVLPVGVKAAGVSSTQMGITSKHLLLGTTADQLLAIPWQMTNPRRPTEKPTEAEMSEGLMQYHAELPMVTTSILSYNHTIANLRGIRAVPADLESTSLVLAYGVDLFFIRVTPSKAFDVLNDDFNYIGLALTVVVLGVASIIVHGIVKKKDLQHAWK
jgi:hypothetical protein